MMKVCTSRPQLTAESAIADAVEEACRDQNIDIVQELAPAEHMDVPCIQVLFLTDIDNDHWQQIVKLFAQLKNRHVVLVHRKKDDEHVQEFIDPRVSQHNRYLSIPHNVETGKNIIPLRKRSKRMFSKFVADIRSHHDSEFDHFEAVVSSTSSISSHRPETTVENAIGEEISVQPSQEQSAEEETKGGNWFAITKSNIAMATFFLSALTVAVGAGFKVGRIYNNHKIGYQATTIRELETETKELADQISQLNKNAEEEASISRLQYLILVSNDHLVPIDQRLLATSEAIGMLPELEKNGLIEKRINADGWVIEFKLPNCDFPVYLKQPQDSSPN